MFVSGDVGKKLGRTVEDAAHTWQFCWTPAACSLKQKVIIYDEEVRGKTVCAWYGSTHISSDSGAWRSKCEA